MDGTTDPHNAEAAGNSMAIDDLLDEHEQSERVRGWLRNNGAGLIGGVILGLAVILGWQWWQQQRKEASEAAGQRFDAATKAIASKDLKKAEPVVKALAAEGNTYATLASLQLAKAQVEAGQRDAAVATLRSIKTADPALLAVVNSRLARLLIDTNKASDALVLLGEKPDSAAAIEARGDALAALGKLEEARSAYVQALAKLDVAAPQRRLVELKLTEVGGTPARSGDKT
jgi:predicted negative regulator of RcsB-dependent stress response